MKKGIRKLLTVILVAVCLVSAGKVALQYRDGLRAKAAQERAKELALSVQAATVPEETQPAPTQPTETEPSETQPLETVWVPAPVTDDPWVAELVEIDLAALQAENPDVLGWIFIPDTNINFPVIQGTDNRYYLRRTWEGESSRHGSIFLECKNSRDMTDFNSIVYGHNMSDGTMFAMLKNYAQEEFFQAHPYIYLVTEQGVFRYEVFATYLAATDSKTYGLSFNQTQTRTDYLEMALENSEIDTGITPAVTDRILTLSTCTSGTYAYRRVVHGRLEMIQVPKE